MFETIQSYMNYMEINRICLEFLGKSSEVLAVEYRKKDLKNKINLFKKISEDDLEGRIDIFKQNYFSVMKNLKYAVKLRN